MLSLKQNITQAKKASLSDYEAHLLLAKVLEVNLTWLRTWPDYRLTEKQQQDFELLCQRRQQGEPIAYLLGEWSFWSFTLQVTPDTLIPRPETEHLVEWVLQQFGHIPALRLADLGTGSGAIALALAMEKPDWEIIATDFSEKALEIAKANAKCLQLPQIKWYSGSWYTALPSSLLFDIIISNPPYIAPYDPHLQKEGLSYEPYSALVAAEKGLADLRLLIEQAPHFLQPAGWLVLEHGYEQALAVHQIFKKLGFSNITTLKDFAGCDRITYGQWVR